MISINSLSALVFIILLCLFLYYKRSRLSLHKLLFPFVYAIMYKGNFGLKMMDSIAQKFSFVLRLLSYAGIFFGFVGIIIICFALIHTIYKAVYLPSAAAGVALVLPIEAKGVFYVPFLYWILSIFVLAVVHEAAHGIVARLHNVRLKSSGFAFFSIFLPIIPAAFVEPDEKQLKKMPDRKQLAVFSAGPFANVLFGFIIFGLFILITPAVVSNMINVTGVVITGFDEASVAKEAGLAEGEQIITIDNLSSMHLNEFTAYLAEKKPGDKITLKTNTSNYAIALAANPNNASKPYLGLYVAQGSALKQGINPFLASIVFWVIGLMYWLYLLNIGVGLFNLVPIGPLDGGRMLQLLSCRFFGRVKGNKAWRIISLFFLFLVVANLALSFLK